MNFLSNIRQWIFEHTIPIMAMGGIGIVYEIGTVWYQNARIVGSAYGLI